MLVRHGDEPWRSLPPTVTGAVTRRWRERVTVGPMAKKWEYATVPLLVHATKQILDNWGQDGWELVQVVPGPNPEHWSPTSSAV